MMSHLEKLAIAVLISASPCVFAGTVTYDGTSFPEFRGWTRSENRPFADRSIEEGWLVLRADVIPQDPPFVDVQEDDFYRRSLDNFVGSPGFFLEWRMETDGPRS